MGPIHTQLSVYFKKVAAKKEMGQEGQFQGIQISQENRYDYLNTFISFANHLQKLWTLAIGFGIMVWQMLH